MPEDRYGLPLSSTSDRAVAAYREGVHGLAHIAHETGDLESGARYLEGWLPAYERASALHCHLSWYLALFELGRGRTDAALRIYEDSIAPGASIAPPSIRWPTPPPFSGGSASMASREPPRLGAAMRSATSSKKL